MSGTTTQSLSAPAGLQQPPELGITFFLHGIRVFIPEGAGIEAIQEAIDVLERVKGIEPSS